MRTAQTFLPAHGVVVRFVARVTVLPQIAATVTGATDQRKIGIPPFSSRIEIMDLRSEGVNLLRCLLSKQLASVSCKFRPKRVPAVRSGHVMQCRNYIVG
jgi:hypothetical protein